MSPPGTTLVTMLLAGSIVYSLGFGMAVWRRARLDLKRTKGAIPGLRKDMWRGFRTMVKVAFWVVLGLVVLVWWTVKEAHT